MESELVIQAKAGNQRAYESLIKAYLPRLYRTAYSFLRNVDDAADICQDVSLRAYRSMQRFDENRSFYPWIYQILKNLCINQNRKRKRYSGETEQIENLKSGYADPEREMLRKEEAAMVRQALESLADMHREILILRTYGDASYSEIAEILSIPEGTVMSRIYNARMKLKSIIQSMEGEENHGL